MDTEVRELVESLHASERMVSMVIAGAGTQAVGWILGVAGASRTVLDVQIPYASSAVTDYLGFEPGQFVSAETARSLARAAYFRAVDLRSGNSPVAGVACTATIATDRLKRGEHRCHVAVYHATGYAVISLTLAKGRRDRSGEDDVVSRLILNGIAEFAAIDSRVDPGLLEGEDVLRESVGFADSLEALSENHVGHVVIGADGRLRRRTGRSAGACFRGRSIRCTWVTRHWPARPRQYSARRWPTKSRSRTWTSRRWSWRRSGGGWRSSRGGRTSWRHGRRYSMKRHESCRAALS